MTPEKTQWRGVKGLNLQASVSRFHATFHPDPSSVVVIVLAAVATRRQPHSVALVCAHRATEESNVIVNNEGHVISCTFHFLNKNTQEFTDY